jgi:hypothetical protein
MNAPLFCLWMPFCNGMTKVMYSSFPQIVIPAQAGIQLCFIIAQLFTQKMQDDLAIQYLSP